MFESARLKLARAEHHIADLEGQFKAFVQLKPHVLSIKHDESTGQPIVQIRFTKRIPDTFSVIIGDAIHNLRCALDHLMWEIIGWDGGTQNRYLQFPVRERKIEFEGACNGIQTPSNWIKQFLLSLECYKGGKGETLYILHSLDNADKHRAITPILRATSHPPMHIFDAAGNRITMRGNWFVGPYRDTGTLPLTNVPPGGHVEFEDDASCPASIFLGEAIPFAGDAFAVLRQFSRAVGEAINLTEREVSKHSKP